MKKNTIRNFAAMLAAASIGFSCFSCGSSAKSSQEAATAEQLLANAYSANDIDVSFDVDGEFSFNQFCQLGNGKIIVAGSVYNNDDYKDVFFLTDEDMNSPKKLDIDVPESGKDEKTNIYSNIVPSKDGGFYNVIIKTEAKGDIEDFRTSEGIDHEAYMDANDVTINVVSYDGEGNKIGEFKVTGLDEKNPDSDVFHMSIYDSFSAGDGKIVFTTNADMGMKYMIVGADGKYITDVKADDDTYINSMNLTYDGRLACSYWDGTGGKISFVNTETGELEGDPISLGTNMMGMLVPGNKDYILMGVDQGCFKGIKEDGTIEEVVNWLDSDIDPDQVQSAIALDNDEYLIYCRNWETGETTVSRLAKVDPSQIKDKKVITAAVSWASSDITSKINAFNKSQDEYRIKLVDYSQYYDYDESAGTITNTPGMQLKKEIAAGKHPDMMIMDDMAIFGELAGKDVFVDMYQYLDNDSDLSRDDIMPNVRSIGEYDGKLYSLAPTFYINTYAVKSKFVEGKDSWTVDELIDCYNKMPKGTKLLEYETQMEVAGIFFNNITNYIDVMNAKCNFDNGDFKKMLEFCKQFPEDEDEDEGDVRIYSSSDEVDDDTSMLLRKDKLLLNEVYISGLREFKRIQESEFGEPVTYIGSPCNDGNGSVIYTDFNISIFNDTEYKDVCWDFVKTFFEPKPENGYGRYGFSALVSDFEKEADEAMQKPYYIDDDGKKVEYDDTYYIGDKEYTIAPLTKEERDKYVEFVKNTNKTVYYSEEPLNILVEEIQAYFKGEKDADTVVDMLQDRISVLLSEQE